jgi:hypothetical protein
MAALPSCIAEITHQYQLNAASKGTRSFVIDVHHGPKLPDSANSTLAKSSRAKIFEEDTDEGESGPIGRKRLRSEDERANFLLKANV